MPKQPEYTPEEDLETDTDRPVLPPVDKSRLVEVTITKFGSGLVSTGVHVSGEGDVYAQRGEKLTVSAKVAASLEALGFAEAD